MPLLGPVRSDAEVEAGALGGPLGEVSFAALAVAGLPTLMAWDQVSWQRLVGTRWDQVGLQSNMKCRWTGHPSCARGSIQCRHILRKHTHVVPSLRTVSYRQPVPFPRASLPTPRQCSSRRRSKLVLIKAYRYTAQDPPPRHPARVKPQAVTADALALFRSEVTGALARLGGQPLDAAWGEGRLLAAFMHPCDAVRCGTYMATYGFCYYCYYCRCAWC